MKKIALVACLAISALTLDGCGNAPGERAISGAGIGAAGGALGGLMFGVPLEGAVIGGAVGAAAGGLTKSNQINLGKPIWR